jgi:hypothetical protein
LETRLSPDVRALLERIVQLQTALDSRIVIEQAKGILAERFKLTVDDAFLLLRYAARSSRRKLHDVARDIISDSTTPQAVSVAIARQQRWRAAGQRERAEAHVEKARAETVRARRLATKMREGKLRPPGRR